MQEFLFNTVFFLNIFGKHNNAYLLPGVQDCEEALGTVYKSMFRTYSGKSTVHNRKVWK